MVKINRNPTRRDLFVFGIGLAIFTVLVGLVAYFRWNSAGLARNLWSGGAVLTAFYFLIARWRRWIFLGWSFATYPIGWTVSHVALAIIFYGVVTPTGLLMRLSGRDPMARRFDRKRNSYWEAWEPQEDRDRYFKQF